MRPIPIDAQAGSALTRAFVAQHEASLKGFDWEDPRDALEKVREEAEEVGLLLANGDGASANGASANGASANGASANGASANGASGNVASGNVASDHAPAGRDSGEPDDRLQEELGDLLFAVVNVARLAGVDPRAALDRATAKFEERFAEVERLARLRGLPMPGTPLADLDRLWDQIKSGNQG